MKLSVGVDSVDIGRIRQSLTKESFVMRVFTQSEREYALRKVRPEESFAGAFCAKEAFLKAVGEGISRFALSEIETLHDEKGAPYVVLHGATAQKYGSLNLSLSITHTEHTATAVVIAYEA